MHITTRVVLQPRGDGEPVEVFDVTEGDLDPYTLQELYASRFGEPHDVACTEVEDLPARVTIGWAFSVPAGMELPGDPDDFEMLLIPMIPEPPGADAAATELQSMFVAQARERRAFEACAEAVPVRFFTAGVIDGTMTVEEGPRRGFTG